jgi:hypothetical protein
VDSLTWLARKLGLLLPPTQEELDQERAERLTRRSRWVSCFAWGATYCAISMALILVASVLPIDQMWLAGISRGVALGFLGVCHWAWRNPETWLKALKKFIP